MATWVTHLMVADILLKKFTVLDRRGFCVGNIAPDCNIENEDWTEFTPPKAVTHWMSGSRKGFGDCERFCEEYILNRKSCIKSNEESSFLLGYYCHLIADAEFQRFIRDEERVRAVWRRIKSDTELCLSTEGSCENWDTAKKLITHERRMLEIYTMEAEYLRDNPNSGYLTDIMPLKDFPDYIDYLPHGCIVRKIGVMGFVPQIDDSMKNPISMSRDELSLFVRNAAKLAAEKFIEHGLV